MISTPKRKNLRRLVLDGQLSSVHGQSPSHHSAVTTHSAGRDSGRTERTVTLENPENFYQSTTAGTSQSTLPLLKGKEIKEDPIWQDDSGSLSSESVASDADYEEQVSIVPQQPAVEELQELSVADTVFDTEEPRPADAADSLDSFDGKQSSVIYVDSFNPNDYSPAVLAYEENLLQLLHMKPPQECHMRRCKSGLHMTTTYSGTALILKWVCNANNNHIAAKWCSQPVLKTKKRGQDTPVANVMLASSVICSGNNFQKVSLLFNFAGFRCIQSRSFYQYQANAVIPEIQALWRNIRKNNIEKGKDTPVVAMGDGRMDSPGFSAKYCTYTVMDFHSKEILHMEIVDKREVRLKSPNMEPLAMQRSMSALAKEGVEVAELITDAHPQITSIMKKSYSTTKHSYDIWHGTKNLGKKLSAETTTKPKADLKPWIPNITKHFWDSARTCEGSAAQLKTKFYGVMHHVTNTHTWALGKCEHEAIEEDDRNKAWLVPNSPSHQSLRKVLFASNFMKTLPYYITCRATAELEAFNNHILMYASKRFAYGPPAYEARCSLAAIDYTMHLDRPYQRTPEGDIKYSKAWSKSACHWKAVPLKVSKTYDYIPDLLEAISKRFIRTTIGKQAALSPTDPRLIQKTIAPVEAPPKEKLIEEREKFSRFSSAKSTGAEPTI